LETVVRVGWRRPRRINVSGSGSDLQPRLVLADQDLPLGEKKKGDNEALAGAGERIISPKSRNWHVVFVC